MWTALALQSTMQRFFGVCRNVKVSSFWESVPTYMKGLADSPIYYYIERVVFKILFMEFIEICRIMLMYAKTYGIT